MNQLKKWLKEANEAAKQRDWEVVNGLKLKASKRALGMAATLHPDSHIAAKIALRIIRIKTEW